ncbi:TolC family protein [Thermomonas sp.]|uniref:TolC family protein n=1 Tax=Thermomonas sp. TaxID=1971895 RepID=UPI00260EE1F2|nr:TolC family protein [Thermomonas sp.]MCO5055718.1 TolC family protein [Thermomonas sp.]
MTPFFRSDAKRSDRSRTRRSGLLLAALLLLPPVHAQQAQEPVPGADVASIRSWLLTHNPELRAQQAEVEAARARVLPAGSLPNPTAAVSLQGLGASGPRLTSFQLRQPLPLWGKRPLARAIAEQQAQAQDASRDATALDLLAQAESAYVRYWHAAQARQLLDGQIALLENVEEIAGVRYALGMAPQQDAIRAQVARSDALGRRIALEQAGEEAAVQLNLTMGRSPLASLQSPQGPPQLPVASITLAAATQRLDRGQHPALRAAQAQLAAAQDSLAPAPARVLARCQPGHWRDATRPSFRWHRVDAGSRTAAAAARAGRPRTRGAGARRRPASARRGAANPAGSAARAGLVAVAQRPAPARTAGVHPHSAGRGELPLRAGELSVGEVDFNALLDALSQWQEAKLARLDAQRDELLAAAAVRAIEGEAP